MASEFERNFNQNPQSNPPKPAAEAGIFEKILERLERLERKVDSLLAKSERPAFRKDFSRPRRDFKFGNRPPFSPDSQPPREGSAQASRPWQGGQRPFFKKHKRHRPH